MDMKHSDVSRAPHLWPLLSISICARAMELLAKLGIPEVRNKKKTLLRMSKRPGLHWNRLT